MTLDREQLRMIERVQLAAGTRDEQGNTRRARASSCGRCRAPVMAGLDDVVLACTAVCDPWPIDAAAEYVCTLLGRATYTLRWIGGRYELDRRDRWQIRGNDPADVEVLAAHRCGDPMPIAQRRPPHARRTPSASSTDGAPPF